MSNDVILRVFLNETASLKENLKNFLCALDELQLFSVNVIQSTPPIEANFSFRVRSQKDDVAEKFISVTEVESVVGRVVDEAEQRYPHIYAMDLDFDSIPLVGGHLIVYPATKRFYWSTAVYHDYDKVKSERLSNGFQTMIHKFTETLDAKFFEIWIGEVGATVQFFDDPYLFASESAAIYYDEHKLKLEQTSIKHARKNIGREDLVNEFREYCPHIFENERGGMSLIKRGFFGIKGNGKIASDLEFVYPSFFIRRNLRRKGIKLKFGILEEYVLSAFYDRFTREGLVRLGVISDKTANEIKNQIQDKDASMRERLKNALNEQEKIDFGLE